MAKEKLTVSDSMISNENGELDFGMFGEFNDVQDSQKPNLSNIPVLKLIQALSPETRDRRTYPDIYPGVIIDDSTKEVMGGTEEDSMVLKVYVLKSWASRVKFPPRNSGISGIECSCPTYHPRENVPAKEDWGSTYGKCRTCMYAPWGVKDGCRPQYNLLVCLASDPTKKFRILLSKTSYKGGKKFEEDWLNMAKSLRNKNGDYPPYFVLPLVVYGKEEENKSKDHYYVFDLQVQPFEKDVMTKELVAKLVAAKKDVEELYAETIKYHTEQVETQKERLNGSPVEEEAESVKTEAFSAIEAAFGKEVDASEVNSDDIPF